MSAKETQDAGSPRDRLARERATALLSLHRQDPPVDVESMIAAAGIPVVERRLPQNVRATIGDIGGQRAIIVNRLWSFSSEAERRWVLAEELGHILLDHRLVASSAPGQQRIGLLELQRDVYEREARAFAAELLMPLARVRGRWFEASTELRSAVGRPREEDADHLIRKLAREFGVTPTAMRIRLERLKLL